MKIYITPEAKQILDLYVDEVDDEISGLGKVRRLGNRILIEEIYLLKQESSSSTTDLDMAAVADFMTEMIKHEGPVEHLKLWWHSHGNMGAFWSGTDEKTVQGFENEWMVSLVVNRRGEYKCRLDVYNPVHLVVEDAELCITAPEPSKELRDLIKKEVEKKVKTKKYYVGPGHHNVGFQGGYSQGRYYDPRDDPEDNRFGPVPSSAQLGQKGVWARDKHGVWRLASEIKEDDKEEVSSKGKVVQKEGSKDEAKELEETWEELGFRPM